MYINCGEEGFGGNELHEEFALDKMVQNIKNIENMVSTMYLELLLITKNVPLYIYGHQISDYLD